MNPCDLALKDIITMTESLSCEEPSLVMVASNSYGQQMTEDKLIAKIVSARKYNPWVLKNTLSKVWKMEAELQVRRGLSGVFIF